MSAEGWPRIVLINPKFGHNVGAAVRAAACLGAHQVEWTGRRVTAGSNRIRRGAGKSLSTRLPREERMKAHRHIRFCPNERPLANLPAGAVPVAVEILPGACSLLDFRHPQKAVYVFGPEDGSVTRAARAQCHHFVQIPTVNGACINLAAAVYLVLYDRVVKLDRERAPLWPDEALLAANG